MSKANEEVLKNDDMRIGCFERTGMLMTIDGSEDGKIKPQGLTESWTIPQLEELSTTNNSLDDDDDNAVDTRSDWDDDVDDAIRERNDSDAINEETDVVVDDQVEGENDDDIYDK